jgi:hypothetical protein
MAHRDPRLDSYFANYFIELIDIECFALFLLDWGWRLPAMPAPKARKKTAFVPRIIFHAATVVGVVPLCAAGVVGCGGNALVARDDTRDAEPDVHEWTVAATCFDVQKDAACGPLGVAEKAFDGSSFTVANMAFDAREGDSVADIGFTVACQCFDGGGIGDGAILGVANLGFDGAVDAGPSDAAPDVPLFTVAYHAFDSGAG